MKTEFTGDILSVRDAEDCIRLTRKYTKGVFRKVAVYPIQGEGFPSRVLTEYYEVYPDLDIGWNMLATDAWAWVWGDVLHVDVFFNYNYSTNKAKIIIHGGNGIIRSLEEGVPGLGEAIAKLAIGDSIKNHYSEMRSIGILPMQIKEAWDKSQQKKP